MKKRQEPTESERSPQGTPPRASADEVESTEEWEAEIPEGSATLECESEELPDCDEETKVVLLPVNPYLVHVYWGIAAHDLKEVGRLFSRLGPRAQPVLRFYDVTQVSLDGTNSLGWFDVEIALGAGNWYVHLQSPAKSYCIDLGLRIEGGGFHRLARSNVAETPRAWPSDKMEESYLLVEGDHPRAETVVPYRAAAEVVKSPLEPFSTGGSQGGEVKGPESKELRFFRTAAPGDTPLEPFSAGEPQDGEEKRAELGDASRSAPTYVESQGGETTGAEPKELRIFRTATPGEIERKLAELYQQRSWEWPGFAPQAGGTREPQPSGKECADLTEVSERSFRAGVSSGQKSSVVSRQLSVKAVSED